MAWISWMGAKFSLRALVWSQNTVSLCRELVMNYSSRQVQQRIFSLKANALQLGAVVLLSDKSVSSLFIAIFQIVINQKTPELNGLRYIKTI